MPQRWYALLEQERISVWYTAPTAIRMLMKAGADLARSHAYPACASSPAWASR
jgi:acetyl-CoA synthetase